MSEPQPSQQLVQMIVGSWVSRAIYVAAKLQIADLLADGPRIAEELAEAAGVAPRPLYRLLRALAGVGVFARDADGRFHLNPLANPLRESGPESLRALAVMLGEEQDRCWDDLLRPCAPARRPSTACTAGLSSTTWASTPSRPRSSTPR